MLPKRGTHIDELKCKKCQASFKNKKKKDCNEQECFHDEKRHRKDKDK